MSFVFPKFGCHLNLVLLKILATSFSIYTIVWCYCPPEKFIFDMGFFSSKNIILQVWEWNLSMGGTGKSVVVTYLICLLQKTKTLATLSRGYGRKTKGLRIANNNDNASTLGDEPFQFLNRYSNLSVIVSENRVKGMESLKLINPIPEVVIMDDIMQHRWVKPDLLIMTTDYNNPYLGSYITDWGVKGI